jgi:hypothetical protein
MLTDIITEHAQAASNSAINNKDLTSIQREIRRLGSSLIRETGDSV